MTARHIPYLGQDFCTVVLDKVAPPGGVRVKLWLEDDTVADIPNEITVLEGSNIGSFDVEWLKVGYTDLHSMLIERGGVPISNPTEMPTLTIVCGIGPGESVPKALSAVELRPRPLGAKKV